MPEFTFHKHDIIILGAGGAGLRAALEAAGGAETGVLSQVFPTRSHTVSAQGGIGASLGNVEPDDWYWHMFDTVKGSDYLGDQDAIEFMCRMAPEVVIELEQMGLPFSRLNDGRIYQRMFGGHTSNFGEKLVARSCAAADRTGHAMLHTLYQQCLKHGVHFFSEFFALELLTNQGAVNGVLAWDVVKGGFHVFQAKAVLFATGGYSRLYLNTSNAHINTGDGVALALKAGYPAEDLEFLQFHPTGIYGAGNLITEAVRGEGGYLVNSDHERFMVRYAPTIKDLASRDVVSRALVQELREGRGVGPKKDHVLLVLETIGEEIIRERLPGIRELAEAFAGVDCVYEPIPVCPTAHYSMGGIPTNRFAEGVLGSMDRPEDVIPGFYAAGEAACASVHGANRLGTNSLLDLIVFGKVGGARMVEYVSGLPDFIPLNETAGEMGKKEVEGLLNSNGPERMGVIMEELRASMDKNCGVVRTGETLTEERAVLEKLKDRYKNIGLDDKRMTYNLDLIEALELGHMLDIASVLVESALARTESRGGHFRGDYRHRDDVNFLKHTMAYLEEDGSVRLDYKPVRLKPLTVDTFEPTERVY